MRFSEKLAKKRKENNLSQEQLADRLGVSRQAVSKWESNQSYPDMEKMIQMCNILNCTLDELLDDGTIGSNVVNNRKTINDYFNDFLKYVTNLYNMFISMKFKGRLKFLIEMVFIIVLLYLGGLLIFHIIDDLIISILLEIPKVGVFFHELICDIFNIILFAIGIILFVHLLKIRYLDYYVTVEDDTVKEKTIEKDINAVSEKMDINNKREKVIIRDPKHSSVSFFNILYKIIIFFIKILFICIAIPIIMTFISLVICLVISLYHLGYGIIFLWIALLMLGCLVINYNVLELMYRFIFNVKQSFKRIFIMTIVGLFLIGTGIALTFVNSLSFEKTSDIEYETKEEIIEMTEDTSIDFDIYDGNVHYVFDNNASDVKVDVKYLKGTKYTLNRRDNNYYFEYNIDFMKMYRVALNDFKNKKIKNYNDNLIDYTVTLSEDNYKKLQNNYNDEDSCIDHCVNNCIEYYVDQD